MGSPVPRGCSRAGDPSTGKGTRGRGAMGGVPSLSPGLPSSPSGGSGARRRSGSGGGGTGPLGPGSELRPDLCPRRGNDRGATPGAARRLGEGSGVRGGLRGLGRGAGSPPGGMRGAGGMRGPGGIRKPRGAGCGGPLPGRCGDRGGAQGYQKGGYGYPGQGGCGVRGEWEGSGERDAGDAKSEEDLGRKGSEVGSPPGGCGVQEGCGVRGSCRVQRGRMRGVPAGGDAGSGVEG